MWQNSKMEKMSLGLNSYNGDTGLVTKGYSAKYAQFSI